MHELEVADDVAGMASDRKGLEVAKKWGSGKLRNAMEISRNDSQVEEGEGLQNEELREVMCCMAKKVVSCNTSHSIRRGVQVGVGRCD